MKAIYCKISASQTHPAHACRAKMHGAQLELHISKQYHKSGHFQTLKIHKKTSAYHPCSIFENVSTVEMHENRHD